MTAVLARAPPPPPPMGHCSNTVLSVLSKDVTETSCVAVEQWALPKAAHNPWIAVRGCASVAHTLSCAATESSMFALWNGGGASSGSLLRVTGDQIDVEDAPADAIAIVTDCDHSLCVLFRNGDIRALGSTDEIRQSGSEVVITAGTGSMLAYVDTNCQLHLYPNKGVGPVQLERIPPFLNVSPEGYVHYVTFSGEVVNALTSAKVQVPKAVMGVASDRRAFACLLPSELHLFDLSTLTPIRRVWVGESHSLGTAMMDGDMCISVLGPLSLAVNTTRADAPPQLLQYRCPETEPATPRVSTTFGDDTIVIDALGVMRIGSFETFEVPVPYQLRRFTIGDVANTTPSLLKTFDDGKVVCSFFDKGLSTIIVGPDVMRLSKVEGLVVDCCWIAPGACRKLVFAGPGVILVASVDTDGMNLCHRIATKAPFFACLSPRDGLVVAVPRVGRITLVEPDGVKETPCQVQDVISASCSPVDGKVRLLSTSGDTYGYISGSVAREGRINGVMTPSTRPCFVQGHPILLSKQDLPVGKTEGIDSGILCGASRQDRVLFALRSDDRTPIPFTV